MFTDILKLSLDEEKKVSRLYIPDVEKVLAVLPDAILASLDSGDKRPLEVLFSITCYLLAKDETGTLEEDYLRNLKSEIERLRMEGSPMNSSAEMLYNNTSNNNNLS